jgi:predicted DNA-binding transcriptional regulator YafY
MASIRSSTGGPAAGAGARGPSGLGVLQRAVFADRRLRLTYRHSGADADARYTVDPYGLVSKAGTWYLVADLHGEPRLFRADRVGAAEVAEEEPVRRRPGVTLGQAWALLRDRVEHRPLPFPVRCRVRRGSWGLFRRLHGTYLRSGGPPGGGHDGAEGGGEGGGDVGAVGGSGEDGWYQVELAFPAAAAVRTLLPLAADVEILDPPSARAELAAAAAEVVALYARS